MGIIIWLVVGGICGWLASLVMRTDAQQGVILNIVVGILELYAIPASMFDAVVKYPHAFNGSRPGNWATPSLRCGAESIIAIAFADVNSFGRRIVDIVIVNGNIPDNFPAWTITVGNGIFITSRFVYYF